MKKHLANGNWQLALAFRMHPTKASPRRHGDTEDTHATLSNAEFVQPLQMTRRLLQSVHSVWDTGVAILREIFDESAYERFLVRAGKHRSVESYREFSREREMSMIRKPRCC
jgi:hypothetical protein